MKIAVIGSNGQLGTDLMKVLRDGHEVTGLVHKDFEVTDLKACQILKDLRPDAIINTAAFHKTDLCEDEPLRTFSVNAVGAKNVATVAKEIDAVDVFISTDYVFDGMKREPYTEDDIPRPINTYGISKLSGELLTQLAPKHYVVRIASVFGAAGASGKGGNFVETMISKAKKGEQINVIDDMWMSPTYTRDAASAIRKMLEMELPAGTYHAANKGFCSWFEFTNAIFDLLGMKPSLTAISSNQFPTKAMRPVFSALNSTRLPGQGIALRDWKDALRDYLAEKGYSIQS